jgi:hypothetical protein
MYTKTVYCCGICNTQHERESQAKQCEELGPDLQTKDIKVGDSITFIREIVSKEKTEDQFEKNLQTFKNITGKVLDIGTVLNESQNRHQNLFIVEMEVEKEKFEGLVAYTNMGPDGWKLFSPQAPKYTSGFAASQITLREKN